MAEARRFFCANCGHAIEAWSDGNPYYVDAAGVRHHAYHPSPEFDRCTGVESPHLCLACGESFQVDSADPLPACLGCGSSDIADTFDLAGKRCPKCKKGKLSRDRKFFCIS